MNARQQPSRLCGLAPLAAMSDSELAQFHRQAGAHPQDSAPTMRSGEAAFFLRRDVRLSDALVTLEQRLRQLDALLGMMAEAPLGTPSSRAQAGACAVLCAEALGLRELVARAVAQAASGLLPEGG